MKGSSLPSGWTRNTKSYLLAGSEGVRLAQGVEDEIDIIFHLYKHASGSS